MKKLKWIPVLIVLVATLAFTAGPGDRYFEIAKNLDIFATLFKEVNTYYVDEVNPNELMQTGMVAMLSSLDPYTNYIPEDRIEDYRTMTTGHYGGIGAVIGTRNKKNLVIMPYEGFSAHRAGLLAGDELISIDEFDVTDKNYEDISKLLKGQAGTEVVLTVKRHGQENPIKIPMLREEIIVRNIPYFGMVDDNVGYIRLSEFTVAASKSVRDALNALKEQGAENIILDLRGNPGGLLSEAINISNIFIPKGSEVVSTKGKMESWNKTYSALEKPLDTEIPLVVLISSMSASASEIVGGVVQDYDRGVLIGTKSFGKGLVQTTRPLTYNAQLKVTTAKYYTPSGRCIQALDYTHRNADGSVGRVPDSLIVAFQTKNGRTVYDGGGIDPDIIVEETELAPVAISLLRKNLIFDYATLFYFQHGEVAAPGEFSLTESEYQEFIDWVKVKEFDYTTDVEKLYKELVKKTKDVSAYGDANAQLVKLENSLVLDKKAELELNKKTIKELLEQEIISRYYFEDGATEYSLSSDPDVQEAIKLFNNPEVYKKILQG